MEEEKESRCCCGSPDHMTDLAAIRQHVIDNFSPSADVNGVHGLTHWRTVGELGQIIARHTKGADPHIISLFSLLHDAARISNSVDIYHGPRAAELVTKLHHAGLLNLGNTGYSQLHYACQHHTSGNTSTDATIGACWDADRLDLTRIGIKPDPQFLSTDYAKFLAGGGGGKPDLAEMLVPLFHGTSVNNAETIYKSGFAKYPSWLSPDYSTADGYTFMGINGGATRVATNGATKFSIFAASLAHESAVVHYHVPLGYIQAHGEFRPNAHKINLYGSHSQLFTFDDPLQKYIHGAEIKFTSPIPHSYCSHVSYCSDKYNSSVPPSVCYPAIIAALKIELEHYQTGGEYIAAQGNSPVCITHKLFTNADAVRSGLALPNSCEGCPWLIFTGSSCRSNYLNHATDAGFTKQVLADYPGWIAAYESSV